MIACISVHKNYKEPKNFSAMVTITRRDSPVLHSLEQRVEAARPDLTGKRAVEFILNSVAAEGDTLMAKMDKLQWKAKALWEEAFAPVYSEEAHDYVKRDHIGNHIILAIALNDGAADVLERCAPEIRQTEEWRQATRSYYHNALSIANLMGNLGYKSYYPRVLNFA